MKEDYLREPIKSIDLEKTNTISEILEAFNYTSFQSRTLAACANIYVEMLEDPDRPVIFLGLAGAMVPGGMKKVISTVIIRNMVDVIVSTGANMFHDFVEAFGGHHYVGSPDADDTKLRDEGIDRIYDTYVDESVIGKIASVLTSLADNMVDEDAKNISSRSFMYKLGELIDKSGSTEDKKDSIIWNCWKHEVPIFVPALNDSAIGLAITEHYIKYVENGRDPITIDQIRDNYEILQIKKSASKTGVIYIGGGVPKNYIQQTAFLERYFSLPNVEHEYGFQITTDSPQWGGLSGCTFKEGISWGKEKHAGKYVTCYCDATIAFPLVVKATLERCKNLKRDRLKFKNLQFP
ncbi:MAG: deoxyhypusine synthase family protein [Candidatus Bathyarchaeia archaeon]